MTFPLSLPGVVAGCLLVFIPVTGEFVIPDLLGGSDTLTIGKTLWTEAQAGDMIGSLESSTTCAFSPSASATNSW